jgi:hypothetical protein
LLEERMTKPVNGQASRRPGRSLVQRSFLECGGWSPFWRGATRPGRYPAALPKPIGDVE